MKYHCITTLCLIFFCIHYSIAQQLYPYTGQKQYVRIEFIKRCETNKNKDLSVFLPGYLEQDPNKMVCVAYAYTTALTLLKNMYESNYKIDEYKRNFGKKKFDEIYYSPDYIFYATKRGKDCNTGITFEKIRKDFSEKETTIPLLKDFKFNSNFCNIDFDTINRIPKQILPFNIFSDREEMNLNVPSFKHKIDNYQPIMLEIKMINELWKFIQNKDVINNIWTYAQDSAHKTTPTGKHAVLIVGYDDCRAAFKAIHFFGPLKYFYLDYKIINPNSGKERISCYIPIQIDEESKLKDIISEQKEVLFNYKYEKGIIENIREGWENLRLDTANSYDNYTINIVDTSNIKKADTSLIIDTMKYELKIDSTQIVMYMQDTIFNINIKNVLDSTDTLHQLQLGDELKINSEFIKGNIRDFVLHIYYTDKDIPIQISMTKNLYQYLRSIYKEKKE